MVSVLSFQKRDSGLLQDYLGQVFRIFMDDRARPKPQIRRKKGLIEDALCFRRG